MTTLKEPSSSQVFEFTDYRSYLRARLGEQGRRTGLRAKACAALRCHSTYLSQVLSEKIHLSLEHAEALNRFFQHTDEEGDFFLLLVQKARAGTDALKRHFERQISEMKHRRSLIKNRLTRNSTIEPHDRDRFYSDWLYTALHALVSIESLRTPQRLADALGISLARVTEALEFLQSIQVVVRSRDGKEFRHGPQHLHLAADDVALISKHHANWRLHALQSIPKTAPGDIHYSATVSLSEEDVGVIRERILKGMERDISTVKLSKEETAYVYCFDFYRLSRV